ncbi:MAG: hypothetical protein DDG59_07735 [Anaerolineae bacterium]|jgi:hypothetical protein|nr:MAG: hypothetical protein DDG59_07735 [Anaerolineae bacterium]
MEPDGLRAWSVADLLTNYPKTAQLFIEWKTQCVGCYLSRFCTLEEVVALYSINPQTFFLKLQKLIQFPSERIET